MTLPLKVSPTGRGLSSEVFARIQSKREALRLHRMNDAFMAEVERRFRKTERAFERETALLQHDLETMHADLTRRAEQVLAALPDFDALHQSPAYPVIREVAAEHDVAIAAIMVPQRKNAKARDARNVAIRAVAAKLKWSNEELGAHFGVSEATIVRVRGGK